MNNLISKYSLYARIIPGLITFLPIFFLFNHLIGRYPEFNPARFFANFHLYFGYISLVSFLFLISFFSREIGKTIERKVFISQDGFPTSYFMLFSNSKFPKELKNKYRVLLKERFFIDLPLEEEEINDKKAAVKQLYLASKVVASFCHDNEDVQNRNIEYGFYRNLLGGTTISVSISIIGFIISKLSEDSNIGYWMIIIGGSYLVIGIVIYFFFLRRAAEDYAYKALVFFISNAGKESS